MESTKRVLCCALVVVMATLAYAADPHTHSVAFSVGLTGTQYIQNKQTIMYDREFINKHYGYNAMTGIFKCPVAGIYIFHFHGYSTNKDKVMWLNLLLNDQVQVSMSGYNSHTVGSNTVMLQLKVGDRVEIQSEDQQQFALFGLPNQVYSTFAGYLVMSMDAFHDAPAPIVGPVG